MNNKADRDLVNSTVPYVVSRTANSNNGVTEIWSDGYCVQTGIIAEGASTGTINLAKSYINTDYLVLANVNIQGLAGNDVVFSLQVRVKSTNNFTYAKTYQTSSECGLANEPFVWRAEGYIR